MKFLIFVFLPVSPFINFGDFCQPPRLLHPPSLFSMKFLIVVFLPVSPFINFGDFCEPPRLLHPPRLLFWPKFAILPVYSAFPFYLKLESTF